MIKKKIFPAFSEDKKCEFSVWAPKANDLKLLISEGKKEFIMNKVDGTDYWKITLENCKPGTRYKYKINDNESFPDPASLSQPEGVHEASEVIDLSEFAWTDKGWKNIPLPEMIQYELHTGTFTSRGNFDGIISKLDYLKDLGINTIEILPVAQFSGKRNWGYDGVYFFAVHDSYGGAFGLMKLVNECHKKGIAVILDVVYNHFGPEGNYISEFGHYFSGKYSTPWGKPLNFDDAYSDDVRNFIIQNALMWCRDFHIDGLRLDAVHAIYDFGAKHIMQELSENLEELGTKTGKKHYLIAESNLNDVHYISPITIGGYGLDAQWSDDFHHAIHTLVTGEKNGYYMDFGKSYQLSKAIKNAFVFDGEYSNYRKKTYGNSTENNKAEQFVIFHQNHDQVGNRKNGERLISLTDFETAKLLAATMFISPNIPMLFMGEEYGERNPFFYFVSHLDPGLNELVRKGRENDFKDFHNDGDIAPDPSSPDTFHDSLLSWSIDGDPEKKVMHRYYKGLIKLRKSHPVFRIPDKENLRISEYGKVFVLERWQNNENTLSIMNFDKRDHNLEIPEGLNQKMKKIFDSNDPQWNGTGNKVPENIESKEIVIISRRSIAIYSN